MAHVLTDEEIDQAMERSRLERGYFPDATSVSFDAPTGILYIEFENGASLRVPARFLQGLEDASDEEIAEVELERGRSLHWETLDADFRIQSLAAGVFGTKRFMADRHGRNDPAAR